MIGSRVRSWLAPLAVTAVGLVGGAVVAAVGGIRAGDAARLIGYSAAGAGLAGIAVSLVMLACRRASVGVQAAIAVLAPILAVALGVAWAAEQMFLMSHDLWVLWVVLFGAGSVGVIVAMVLGRRVATATRSVGAMARRLGDGSYVGGVGRAPGELAELAAELQQTSIRLAEAREQAAVLEASRRELVAWVSHDLRTPLAGIRAMVEALKDGVVDDPDTVARYHRTMRREADRLAGLVDDLFELSRIQAGSLSLQFEAVPLDELVSDAIAGAAIAADAKDVRAARRRGPAAAAGRGLDSRDRPGGAQPARQRHPPHPPGRAGHRGRPPRRRWRRRPGVGARRVRRDPRARPRPRVRARLSRRYCPHPGRRRRRARPGRGPRPRRGPPRRHQRAEHGAGMLLHGPTPRPSPVKVLVTGGAGFIGSHIVDALLAEGCEVRVLDSLDVSVHGSAAPALDPRAELLIGNITDVAAVEAAVSGVDAVCHQAAKVGLGVDFGDVDGYVTDNDLGTGRLLGALWRRGWRGRFVLASSMVVYGSGCCRCPIHGLVRVGARSEADLEAGVFEPRCPLCAERLAWVAVTEAEPPAPRNIYAATKLHQEHLCEVWGRETDNTVVALRYHNVYGPRMPRDTPYAGVAAISGAQSRPGGDRRRSRTGGRRATSCTCATWPGPTCWR